MRRIQRDICHEEFIKSMISGDSPIFREIWRLMFFAAALGIKNGIRRPLVKVDSGKAFPDNYFNTPVWPGFLYLIRVCETGDSECLRGTSEAQETLITAFEEYANQGLFLLRERMESSSFHIDELASLLLEASTPSQSAPIIDDLI